MAGKKLSATITIGGAVAGTLGLAVKETTTKLGEIGKVQQRLGRDFAKLGAMGLGMAGAIAGLAAVPIKAAVDFETAMLGVAKQVAGARDASGKLTPIYHQMGKEIQALGRSIPMATNDLAAMAAAGARMDIPRDQLIEFTKTAAMMAEAFELPAAELADQMGKIKKLFGLGTQKEVTALADAVNYLDDNAISKGGDIIDFLTRTGGLAGSVKVTGSQMAALGSTLLTLGERTESAGTAVNAIFGKFAAAESGTKKFKMAMRQLGLSTREVQKGMQVDAQGTLIKVLDKVRSMPKDQQLGILTQLVGLEHADTLAKLANGVEEYRKQIALTNAEGAKGSMAREFSARLQTTSAQWEILKNRTTEFAVNIGATLLPKVNELIGTFGTIITSITDWTAKNPALGATIISVAEGIGVASAAIGVLCTGLGAVVGVMNVLKATFASNPLGLALTLLATAGVMIYQNWAPIKELFVSIWDTLKGIFGFGGSGATVGSASAGGASLPNVAPVASRGSTVNAQTTNNIALYQQVGENGVDFMKRLRAELDRQAAIKQRSLTVDPAGAY